ncbi:MAG: TetR family transcriptional regulator [Bacteroidia bacterium]|nr:TetR family transcriptional regulator [Bacteroidia bacterium]
MPESLEPTRREQIMSTAQKMMRSNGYQGTSMRDIAAALQIEAASLYNHISSKEEILRSTCFGMADKFITGINEVNDIYFNAEEKLAMAVRNHIKVLTENLNASFVFIHEWRNLAEESRKEFVSLRDEYENQFRKILETGEEEGLFNEVNNKFAVLTILSSLNWVVEWYRPDGEMNPQQIAEKLNEFILTGLKK